MMKRLFLFFVFSLFASVFVAQTQTIKFKKEKFQHARFRGGEDSLKNYLHSKVGSRALGRVVNKIEMAAVVSINPKGKVTKTELTKSSGVLLIDSLFIDALKNSPVWDPAHNDKGVSVADQVQVPYKPNAAFTGSPAVLYLPDTVVKRKKR